MRCALYYAASNGCHTWRFMRMPVQHTQQCGMHAHRGAALADRNARRAAVRNILPRPHCLPQPGGAGGVRGVRGLPRLPGGPGQPATAHVYCPHSCRRALPQSTCAAPGCVRLLHTVSTAPSRKVVLPDHAAPMPSCEQCCTAHTPAGMSWHNAPCITALPMRLIPALLHQTEVSTSELAQARLTHQQACQQLTGR
jgi:hypothetical protein